METQRWFVLYVSIRQNFVTGEHLVLQLSLLSLSAFIQEAHGKALSWLPHKAGAFQLHHLSRKLQLTEYRNVFSTAAQYF